MHCTTFAGGDDSDRVDDVTAGPSASPAAAKQLTPSAAVAVKLADQIPAAERKRLIESCRQTRAKFPFKGFRRVAKSATAPPICRDAFPRGRARDICADMIAGVRDGAKATWKCMVGSIAVVARPMGKTVAMLTGNCGPQAAALAVGAALAFLNDKCKAITPKFLEWSCNLMF